MATSSNVLLPSPIQSRGDLAIKWEFFKEQWEDYITPTESAVKDKLIKATLLQTVMEQDCLKILKSINLSSSESQDSKTCLQELENHFKPAKNEAYERFKFYTCNQGPNELAEQWLTLTNTSFTIL